jgi:putative ABC transport system ATP-binding protein
VEITNILKECAHQMNKCIIIVTHSNELAKQTDVILKLRRGELQIADTPDSNAGKGRKTK